MQAIASLARIRDNVLATTGKIAATVLEIPDNATTKHEGRIIILLKKGTMNTPGTFCAGSIILYNVTRAEYDLRIKGERFS